MAMIVSGGTQEMAAQDAAGITLNDRRNYKRLTRANGLAIVYLSAMFVRAETKKLVCDRATKKPAGKRDLQS